MSCYCHEADVKRPHSEFCGEISPKGNWSCTRKKGHRGEHHAHMPENICLEIWDNKEEQPEKEIPIKENLTIPKGVVNLF